MGRLSREIGNDDSISNATLDLADYDHHNMMAIAINGDLSTCDLVFVTEKNSSNL